MKLTELGDIPCFKLYETEKTLAFLDINPLSSGHAVRGVVKDARLHVPQPRLTCVRSY